jgi:hypothetical protein
MLDKPGYEVRRLYRIRISGQLDPEWADWLGALHVIKQEADPTTTVLVCLADQAKLRGILNRVWDLNLIVMDLSSAPVEDREQLGEGDLWGDVPSGDSVGSTDEHH